MGAATRPLAGAASGAPARGTPRRRVRQRPGRTCGPRAQFVFSVAADGLLRGYIPDTWRPCARACQFSFRQMQRQPAHLADGFGLRRDVEHVRRRADGGVTPWTSWRMAKPVTQWESQRCVHCRLALSEDGTVYVTTVVAVEYANSVVALEGKTLKLKIGSDRISIQFHPVVFSEGEDLCRSDVGHPAVRALDGPRSASRSSKPPRFRDAR